MNTTEDHGLTRDDVQAMPPSPLRSVLLASFQVEANGHQMGWDNVRPTILQYLMRPDEDDEAVALPLGVGVGAYPWQMLEAVAEDLSEAGADFKALISRSDATFGGTSMMYEGWIFGGTLQERLRYSNVPLPDVPGSIETRFVKGALVDGTPFIVIRPRGYEPFALVDVPGIGVNPEAVEIFNRSLARLNDAIQRAYHESPADMRKAVIDPPTSDAEAMQQVPIVPVRWRKDEPRAQRAYPPLPADHPHTTFGCPGCAYALGNKAPLQLYVLGPDPDDAEEMKLYHEGRWHTAMAMIVHRDCVATVEQMLNDIPDSAPTTTD